MATPNALKALGPVWFRFTDPEDMARYGDGWFKYDEGGILRQRADVLIALETDLGMSMVSVMNGFRANTVLGDTAVAWMGVRAKDQRLAGDFDQFTPVTMMIEWSKAIPESDPKEGEPESLPGLEVSSLPTPSPSESTISGPTDTVVLSSMPIAGS